MKIRGQFAGISSILLPRRAQGLNAAKHLFLWSTWPPPLTICLYTSLAGELWHVSLLWVSFISTSFLPFLHPPCFSVSQKLKFCLSSGESERVGHLSLAQNEPSCNISAVNEGLLKLWWNKDNLWEKHCLLAPYAWFSCNYNGSWCTYNVCSLIYT